MKAVLGVLVLLIGFVLAYYVLSGKFPGSVPSLSSGGSQPTPPLGGFVPSGNQGTGGAAPPNIHADVTPFGPLPTVNALDILSSNGGGGFSR